MAITVTATVEASNIPPRVRLNVSASAGETSATITRANPDGTTSNVRTDDGGPVTISGGAGLVYDYEAPYGQAVTYSSLETPGNVSASVTVDESRVWLIHPGVPALSMPVEWRADSFAEETWGVQQGTFFPMGRKYPVVQNDGQRKAASSSATVAIESLTELASLRSLVDDAGTLLLNVPPSLELGVDTCYISVGEIRNRRLSDIGSDPMRSIVLPYQVVDRPEGGTQAQRTWADVVAENATWNVVKSKYATWNDLLAG